MIYFITVCGFFVGLMFCIINIQEPTDVLLYTLEITLFFYLLAHVAIMNFIDTTNVGKNIFKQDQFEDISSYFIHEIEEREKRMDALLMQKRQPQVTKRKKKQHGHQQKKAA